MTRCFIFKIDQTNQNVNKVLSNFLRKFSTAQWRSLILSSFTLLMKDGNDHSKRHIVDYVFLCTIYLFTLLVVLKLSKTYYLLNIRYHSIFPDIKIIIIPAGTQKTTFIIRLNV